MCAHPHHERVACVWDDALGTYTASQTEVRRPTSERSPSRVIAHGPGVVIRSHGLSLQLLETSSAVAGLRRLLEAVQRAQGVGRRVKNSKSRQKVVRAPGVAEQCGRIPQLEHSFQDERP